MGIPLKLLLVEDSETDAVLLLHHLRKGGYEVASERVETKEEMESALDKETWDVIVSDLILPNFSGLGALEVLGRMGLDLPLIMVSGKAGEETAVTAMKAGARDYILKDNMARLAPAIDRELKEAAERKEGRRAKEELDVVTALLQGAQAILRSPDFKETAREIFTSCMGHVGADVGCLTILGRDGQDKEVVYMAPGGAVCPADRAYKLSSGDLGERVYATGRSAYDNSGSENVLLAPLVIDGKPAGLIELGSKAGGFNDEDATVAATFADMAAIALQRGRAVEHIEASERRFRSVVETASDAVIVTDSAGMVVYWNRGAERIFGYTPGEAAGRDLSFIIPERYRDSHAGYLAAVMPGGEQSVSGRTVELQGLRNDGTEVPVELSLATWKSGESVYLTGIVRDITERKELERQRSDFYAMVTHDIKSPLATIIGVSDLILETKANKIDQDTIRLVRSILQSGEKLNRLVGDFLAHARLESGAARLDMRPLDISSLAAEIRDSFAMRAKEAGLTLDLDAPGGLPPVYGDRLYILRAIENLVGNAVAYTPRGGEVGIKTELETAREGACIVISVSDTGPGIPPEDQAKVFDKYYRSSATREVRGSGLGLAIVKAVADAHGASVSLQSSPGTGSTFRLCIPLKAG